MKKIFFGLLFLLTAVFIILSALGVSFGFISQFSTVNLLLAALLLIVALSAFIDRNFSFIPFPLAIAFFFLEKDIAKSVYGEPKNIINNWLVFGCAVLMSVGIEFITSSIRKKYRIIRAKSGKHSYNGTFASETKFIDCTDFDTYFYMVKMGDGKVFFENIDAYKGGATLTVECKMGDIEINVPKEWNVVADVNTSMGDFSLPRIENPNGPTLFIKGKVSMGNVDVRLV